MNFTTIDAQVDAPPPTPRLSLPAGINVEVGSSRGSLPPTAAGGKKVANADSTNSTAGEDAPAPEIAIIEPPVPEDSIETPVLGEIITYLGENNGSSDHDSADMANRSWWTVGFSLIGSICSNLCLPIPEQTTASPPLSRNLDHEPGNDRDDESDDGTIKSSKLYRKNEKATGNYMYGESIVDILPEESIAISVVPDVVQYDSKWSDYVSYKCAHRNDSEDVEPMSMPGSSGISLIRRGRTVLGSMRTKHNPPK